MDKHELSPNRISPGYILRGLAATVVIAGLPATHTVIEANEAGADISCPEGRSPGWVDSSTAEGEPVRVYGCVRDSTPVITAPPTTARPPEQPSPTGTKTTAPTTATPKSNTAQAPTTKQKTNPKTIPQSSVTPPTTDNSDKDGNGVNDKIDFVNAAISEQATSAEIGSGYEVFRVSEITDIERLEIIAGAKTVEQVLAAHQNPAPTTSTLGTTTTAAETTSTTAVALPPETPDNNSDGQLAAGNVAEVVVTEESNLQAWEIAGGALTVTGLAIAVAALIGRIRLHNHNKNKKNKGHGLGGDGMRPAF